MDVAYPAAAAPMAMQDDTSVLQAGTTRTSHSWTYSGSDTESNDRPYPISTLGAGDRYSQCLTHSTSNCDSYAQLRLAKHTDIPALYTAMGAAGINVQMYVVLISDISTNHSAYFRYKH